MAVSENTVSSVLVREEGRSQNPIYYVSKMLQGAEKRYFEMERLALALVVTARKLRPYFQSHKIVVLTNHPLKHVMTRPEGSGRLVKWAIELGKYDIDYRARVAQKAQVVADFMVELMGDPAEESKGKWMLHVDGSSNASNRGAGIWIQGPERIEIEVVAKLFFSVTNNEAEYEAMILGLELAHETGAKDLEVFTDFQLVAMQVEGTYETRERTMVSYKEIVQGWMGRFYSCTIQQIPRNENDEADALSKFGATMSGIRDRKITALVRERAAIGKSVYVNLVEESKSWKDEIVGYLQDGTLPSDPVRAKRIKFYAICFTIISGQLYKRTVDGPLLKCLNPERAEYVLREIQAAAAIILE
ncbi:uncharacterized protein LOC105157489 [Sesamum indicum]|uniref:Uncharacterized protein LOC105157489 n=1 Tax=Sesamum indicum TaxID=4182 RepID=A0A6I9SQV6_SESIN|nr:uncharacterized protein LOC105157489 [Sesamum indicum]